jgi:hypothetical protein
MAALILRVVASGKDVDRVELRDGTLHYSTGRAWSMFESRRSADVSKPPLTDAEVYQLFSDGWSNGYMQLIPTE